MRVSEMTKNGPWLSQILQYAVALNNLSRLPGCVATVLLYTLHVFQVRRLRRELETADSRASDLSSKLKSSVS